MLESFMKYFDLSEYNKYDITDRYKCDIVLDDRAIQTNYTNKDVALKIQNMRILI